MKLDLIGIRPAGDYEESGVMPGYGGGDVLVLLRDPRNSRRLNVKISNADCDKDWPTFHAAVMKALRAENKAAGIEGIEEPDPTKRGGDLGDLPWMHDKIPSAPLGSSRDRSGGAMVPSLRTDGLNRREGRAYFTNEDYIKGLARGDEALFGNSTDEKMNANSRQIAANARKIEALRVGLENARAEYWQRLESLIGKG
jgi:hypothetical protein